MSTTVESLELAVQSNAQQASNGIDQLKESLGRLKTATSGGAGLSSFNKKLTTLQTGLSNISHGSVDKLDKLARGLQGFSGLSNLKISSSVANQIGKIGEATKQMNGADFTVLNDMVNALSPLSTIGKSNLSTHITQLGKLPETLSKLDDGDIDSATRKIQKLVDAISPLASQMATINTAFNALPKNLRKTIGTIDNMTTSTRRSANSYVNLAAKAAVAFTALRQGGQVVAQWIDSSNEYVESLNLFNASMGKYADEAYQYAETVSEIMGIDPAAWLKHQGVFMTLATGFGVVNDRAYIMSQNLTQLGYDLSSFFNITYEDAMQKLQSGISGELEPLRRLGYDLSAARLQQEAYTLGIQKNVNAMTQAEKAELRYYAIMNQVTVAQGDMARTLEAPANQIRILQAAVSQCSRALGNIFIPALNAVLPYAIALANVIRMLANAIASLFGFALPEIDYSGITDAAGAAGGAVEDLDSGLGGAADKAKEIKNALLGIDELNIISPPEDTSGGGGGSGAGGGGGGGFDFPLPTYDFIGDAVNQKVAELTEKMKDLLPLIGLVGGAFATWGLTQWLAKLMGLTDVIGALTAGDYLSVFAGLLMTVGGALLYVSGAADALENGVKWANLIDMLTGVALAAQGVYLILKPFSTTLAPIVSSIVAAAGGIGIMAISLKDLEKHGATIENLVGSIGGLVTAVAALAIGFKNCKLAIAPLIAPLVAFAGSLEIFEGFVTDLLLNGANATNVIGSLVGGIGAITAAVVLLTTACNVNPIFLFATIAIGIISAVKGVADAISDAGEEAYQASEDYQVMQNILERCAETSERCTTAIDTMNEGIKNLDTTSYDFATASHLLEEIYAINGNANASAYELELMAVKVDILNGLNIDGLSLSIDETTGRVIQSREEVEKLIASLEQEARMEAMRDLLVQSYKDQYTAMADAQQALNDYNAASEALSVTTEKLANCPWYSNPKLHSELKAAQEEQTKAVEAAEDAYNQAMDTYDALTGTISFYTDELVDMKLEEAGVGDELCEGLNVIEQSLGDTAGRMEGYGEDIAEGLRKGVDDNTDETQYKSIWQKIGDWFANLFGIHSPSTVFKGYGEDIVDGLSLGLETYTDLKSLISDWGTSIKEWFTAGEDGKGLVENFMQTGTDIVNGFKDKIGSGYPTSKTNMTTWASKVKEWFTNSSYGGVNRNNFSIFANDTIEGFRSRINSSYPNSKSSMTTWASSVRDWFTNSSFGGVNSTNFSTFANNVITGFKDRINTSYPNSQSSMTTWASSVRNWFTSSSFGGVNNSNFQTYANNIIDGFRNKINASYGNSQSSMTTWASSVKSWFTGSSYGSVNNSTFQTYASNIIDGFKNRINWNYGNSSSAMTSWASGVRNWFTNSSYGSVNGTTFSSYATNIIDNFKNRISNYYSTATAVMKSFGSNVISAFQYPNGSYSITSSFWDIGYNIVQGFINGVNNLWDRAMSKIYDFGQSVIAWGKKGTDEASPSRAFKQIGAFVIEGFNIGLDETMPSTFVIMDEWLKGINDFTPTVGMSFAVDTSALKYYTAEDITKAVSADVSTHGTYSVDHTFGHEEIRTAVLEALNESTVAADMRRQADKKEQTVVQVGNRTITDAVTTQQNANGYRFVTA